MKQTISESEARKKYHEFLEETNTQWIKNYPGQIFKKIDPTNYEVGNDDFLSNHCEEYEVDD